MSARSFWLVEPLPRLFEGPIVYSRGRTVLAIVFAGLASLAVLASLASGAFAVFVSTYGDSEQLEGAVRMFTELALIILVFFLEALAICFSLLHSERVRVAAVRWFTAAARHPATWLTISGTIAITVASVAATIASFGGRAYSGAAWSTLAGLVAGVCLITTLAAWREVIAAARRWRSDPFVEWQPEDYHNELPGNRDHDYGRWKNPSEHGMSHEEALARAELASNRAMLARLTSDLGAFVAAAVAGVTVSNTVEWWAPRSPAEGVTQVVGTSVFVLALFLLPAALKRITATIYTRRSDAYKSYAHGPEPRVLANMTAGSLTFEVSRRPGKLTPEQAATRRTHRT